MPVARIVEYTGTRPGRQVWTWCPGCDSLHPFTIEAPPGPTGERLNSGTTWDWDGDLEHPTFSPSLLVYTSVRLCEHVLTLCPAEDSGHCDRTAHLVGYRMPDGSAIAPKVHPPVPNGATKALVHDECVEPAHRWGNCHSFLRAGRWEFLSDSAHHLAGHAIDMVALPDSRIAD